MNSFKQKNSEGNDKHCTSAEYHTNKLNITEHNTQKIE